jgi:hypothetical protein
MASGLATGIPCAIHTYGLKHVPPDLRNETEKFGPIHVVHGRTHGIGPGAVACVANSFQDFSAGLAKKFAHWKKIRTL